VAVLNLGLIAATMAVALRSAPAQAVSPGAGSAPAPTWITNGAVYSVARVGNTVYLGGAFDYVGPSTGAGVPVGTDGAVVAGFPQVTGGNVWATVPDGSGGWYLGGSFASVGGVSVPRLAHVNADHSVDAAFAPSPNNTDFDLAVSGTTVYAGGEFTAVNDGTTRNRLAAFDSATGTATSWNPDVDGRVFDLEVSGSTVYVGGLFTTVNGGTATRNFLAAFDTATGVATAWDPDLSGHVTAIALSGTTLYAGGAFTTVNGGAATRNFLAAFDTATGVATAWDPDADDTVYGLAVSGSTVYAGGDFTAVNGGAAARNHLAAFDTTTGVATSWDPDVNIWVWGLDVSSSTVYAAGGFWTVGDSDDYRIGLAAFPAPANTARPLISGSPDVGRTMACSTGTWANAPDSFARQWTRNGAPIPGATAASYKITTADPGTTLGCTVTAANPLRTAASATGVKVPFTMTINDASLKEPDKGSAKLAFTVSLSAKAKSTVTVKWGTKNGSAKAGSDFKAAKGTLSIKAGKSSGSISVAVTGDRTREKTEKFSVVLSGAKGATVKDATAVGTIRNDD
jgi:hypothetical protein